MPSSLSAYLDALPGDRRSIHSTLSAALRQRLAPGPALDGLVFIPGEPRPVHGDHEEVFWQATEQLMLSNPSGEDELPLAWLGYHVKSRFSGRREAQGFLITDRRLVVKDDVDGIFGKALPRQYPLFTGPGGAAASAAETTAAATESYNWEYASGLLDHDRTAGLSRLLADALHTVLELSPSLGAALPQEPVTATDLRGRVQELGLGDVVKYDDDPKQTKHFAKAAKKLPLEPGERLLAAFTSATLMGVYGLLITDRRLLSRDLGEEPVSTDRAAIDPDALRLSPDNDRQIIAAPGAVHQLPEGLSPEQRQALVTLLREYAEGRVA
ncbi:hypothetical protein [Arthrobacter woluwensis]|uniref:hypothetical protein n=1 Tax=Arthrobacter woluwensis TaxID=156980 RepID=UPI00119F9976|nr:hypothetical protein [Arthrobacter woluwensis]